jgi:hypothetical protein
MEGKQSDPPLFVTKQNELLPEEFDRQRRSALRQFLRKSRRLPIAPE